MVTINGLGKKRTYKELERWDILNSKDRVSRDT